MQLLIMYGGGTRSRSLQLNRWTAGLVALLSLFGLLVMTAGLYHFVLLAGAREGWAVVGPVMRLVAPDEMAQRDRFLRENLDAIAQKVGEVQAKLVRLEAMGERVIGLAGVKPEELKPLERPTGGLGGDADESSAADAGAARGGPYIPLEQPSLRQLQEVIDDLDLAADQSADVFTLMESRLLESRFASLVIPSEPPVGVPYGSGFGFRTDPFNGRPALHTGLDFPANVGTPIRAAAGGIVVTRQWHPAYGNMLEIDHGNGLVTRYAHTSSILVAVGALVRRGQVVAKVGNTGRSTGPHLHFEVLVEGVPQNPARFLAGRTEGGSPLADRPQDSGRIGAAG